MPQVGMCHCAHNKVFAGLLTAAIVLGWSALAGGQAVKPASDPASGPAATSPAGNPSGHSATRSAETAATEESSAGMPLPEDHTPIQTAGDGRPNALWSMFASMIVIVVIGGVALIVIKKVLPRLGMAPTAAAMPGPKGRMKVIESLRLGPQRHVHVLEVEGRRYLVGHTASTITMLAELPAAAAKEESK